MRFSILFTFLLTVFGCGRPQDLKLSAVQRGMQQAAERDPAYQEAFRPSHGPAVAPASPETKSEQSVANQPLKTHLLFQLPARTPIVISYFYGPRIMTSLEASLRLEKNNDNAPVALNIKTKLSRAALVQKYWQFHSGIDFSLPQGSEVRSTADGEVFAAGKMACVGKSIAIKHTDPVTGQVTFSIYEHLLATKNAASVKAGQQVKGGQIIGLSGHSGTPVSYTRGSKSGCVAGNHLHFEIRVVQDPQSFVNVTTSTTKRFELINSAAFRVNPADYVDAIDQLCIKRKTLELANSEKILALNSTSVPPLSAGRCGQNFEANHTQQPEVYQRK